MSTEAKHVRKTRVGRVVSTKMNKTIVIEVERRIRHKLYGKEIRRSTKFHAHDQDEVAQLGDTVEIRETKPISKTKCWTLVKVISHRD